MTERKDNNQDVSTVFEKKTLTLKPKTDTRLVVEKDHVHQSFARGRSKTVEVEVRRKRFTPGMDKKDGSSKDSNENKVLSNSEFDVRVKALKDAMVRQKEEENQQKILLLKAAEEAKLAELERLESLAAKNAELLDSKIPVDEDKEPLSDLQTEASSSVEHKQVTDSNDAERMEEKKPTLVNCETIQPNNYTKNNSQSSDNARSKISDQNSYSGNYRGNTSFSGRNNEPRPQKPFNTSAVEPKKPFSREDIKPIVLRASGYGTRPAAKGPATTQEPILIDPILEKKRSEHRVIAPKVRRNDDEEDDSNKSLAGKLDPKKPLGKTKSSQSVEMPRKLNRNVLTRVLDDDSEKRGRSLASVRRARQKHHKQNDDGANDLKISREVIIPESITVGELAVRMAVRGAEVVKALMKLGMMVTINQVIDGDTAELVCTEFGHTPKRVSDSDIEIGLGGDQDNSADLAPRAPVVTVMGHVDHGKTSLLDALRSTDVVSGEAGGITQHIGAYQVTMQTGKKITFIDTPGHAAFSEMRARGANATDIVVLVVAADDGIMEQTIEAINHAKAADVPIVVAINKIDKPDSNPMRVRQELLQHGVLLEEFGGDIMAVEVSAKKRLNLEKLEEIILLQAEVLDLKANPNRTAQGVVVEAKIDKGRGTVATILVQRGTLRIGDIFVAGSEWGRVKALVDDHGKRVENIPPSVPVEVLGFNGVPSAGDEFVVVDSEQRAREISEYRQHRIREKLTIIKTKGGMESIMSRIVSGDSRELALVIKADVQGSLEAIMASVNKLATDEVSTRVLHGAVGSINESDVTLAKASGGMIVGFNVRANPQARDLAKRDGVEIRYYSIIYDVLDEVKALMSGLLAPTLREKYQGTAEIRNVFTISKVEGKVAGCYITNGLVKRGAKVRLLRDNVVIHEGDLKSLKRFKDEVKEVKESYECGMVFENFHDIKEGDIVECFEIESIARKL